MAARIVYDLGREVTRARELGGYRLRSGSARAEWARCGGRDIACWRGPRRSSWCGPTRWGGRRPERRDSSAAAFEREAQSTAAMRSPHTIDLYDFGVADDGTFYYVMELLDGFDLADAGRALRAVPAGRRAVHFLRRSATRSARRTRPA